MNEAAHDVDIKMFNVNLVPEDYLFKGSLINASVKWMLITIGKIELGLASRSTNVMKTLSAFAK
jgi:hypothetical protein